MKPKQKQFFIITHKHNDRFVTLAKDEDKRTRKKLSTKKNAGKLSYSMGSISEGDVPVRFFNLDYAETIIEQHFAEVKDNLIAVPI